MDQLNQVKREVQELAQEEKKLQKQLEDYLTETILNEKKARIAYKKREQYANELQKYSNENEFMILQEEYKNAKLNLANLEKEEEKISNDLLPYLKFKTCSKNIKPTDFYDMIINCSSILKLLESGWLIQFNKKYTKVNEQGENNLKELIKKFNNLSYQLGIIGDANKGKSYLISQICAKRFRENNIETPTGMTVSTKGLSVIQFEFEKNRFLDILDSEGFHAPIQYEMKQELNEIDQLDQQILDIDNQIKNKLQQISNEEKEKLKKVLENPEEYEKLESEQKNIVDMMQEQKDQQLQKEEKQEENSILRQKKFNDRQVSEKLIQQFIIKFSSMIIILVGDLNLNEQKLIEQVIIAQDSRPVIIVHNMFKILTFQELQEKIQLNINESFQVQKQTYLNSFEYYQGIEKIQDKIKYRQIFHIPFGYQASDELLSAIKVRSQQEWQEFSKIREQNEKALDFIKDKVLLIFFSVIFFKINFYYSNISQLQKRSLIQSLKDHFTENISDYLDFVTEQTNPNYYQLYQKFNNIDFELKNQGFNYIFFQNYLANNKEQLLCSNELIQLNKFQSVNLKLFNFDSNNQIVIEPGQQKIRPKYTLFLKKQNGEKKLIIWIEMPPVSEEDIPEIISKTHITKDSSSYILKLSGFKRDKNRLFKLFGINNGENLYESDLQAADKARQYKIDGTIEVDIKLCSIRQMKVSQQITKQNVQVSDGGVVKFEIDCEDIQQEFNNNDDQEDENEKYLNE